MTETLSLPEIEALARDCLVRASVAPAIAENVAAEVTAAEAAGERHNGFDALLRDLRLIRYGKLAHDAAPALSHSSPGILTVNAHQGFATPALAVAQEDFIALTRQNGLAMLRLDQASAPGSMHTTLAPLARAGLLAMGFSAQGPGRFSHPDDPRPRSLTPNGFGAAMSLFAATADQLDDPFSSAASHQAWLIAWDPQMAGPAALSADLWHAAPPLPSLTDIDMSSDLLEQIVTA